MFGDLSGSALACPLSSDVSIMHITLPICQSQPESQLVQHIVIRVDCLCVWYSEVELAVGIISELDFRMSWELTLPIGGINWVVNYQAWSKNL